MAMGDNIFAVPARAANKNKIEARASYEMAVYPPVLINQWNRSSTHFTCRPFPKQQIHSFRNQPCTKILHHKNKYLGTTYYPHQAIFSLRFLRTPMTRAMLNGSPSAMLSLELKMVLAMKSTKR